MVGIRQTSIYILSSLLISLFVIVSAARGADQDGRYITDAAGRAISLPRQVKRIVPLGGALRFVTYLQGLDTVVGIEEVEKKFPEAGRLYGLVTAEMARTMTTVSEGGPGGKLPDFEKVISVHPDAIVTVGYDISQVETIQQKTGIPVVILNTGMNAALDLQQTRESLLLLGKIIDRKERADTLIALIDQLEEDLTRRTAPLTDRPSVYIGAVGYRGKHGIASTEVHYAPLAWIHGHNVADVINLPGHAFIDQEKLLLWNPDFIFLDAGGLEQVGEDFLKNPAYYQMLHAVKTGRVFVMPPYNYYYTNIEIALANAYFLGKTLYPERFTDIDPGGKADMIFNAFVGLKAYGQLQKEKFGFGRVVFSKSRLSVQ
jgi:iron complex transport system substrate-binding protein